jgi:hypothetical protein
MDKSDNRARVRLRPLGDDAPRSPPGYTLLAVMDAPREGWLARSQAGVLVCYTGHGVASVDARKAQAAYEKMMAAQVMRPDDPAELAADLKRWRGDMSIHAAAAALGVSARTLEGVEQGRGFAHPRLLRIAMAVVKVSERK